MQMYFNISNNTTVNAFGKIENYKNESSNELNSEIVDLLKKLIEKLRQ